MRERLTERVHARLVNKGTPPQSADRQAVNAVDNYYNGVEDEHSDLVAAEACREFADHLMARAPRMAEAWEHLATLAQDVEHMKSLFTGTVMSLHVDGQRNARTSMFMDSVKEAGTKMAEGLAKGLAEGEQWMRDRQAEGVQSVKDLMDDQHLSVWGNADDDPAEEPGDDVITGYPDHHIVNGDPNSCGCPEHLAGHSVMCEVRNTPSWQHAVSLCNVTRTNCRHSDRNSGKHTYGQRCEGDESSAEQFYTGHSRDCATQGGHSGTDCNKHRAACFHNPRHLYKERCPRG